MKDYCVYKSPISIVSAGGGSGGMLPDNFGAALTCFMKERGITIEGLAELTGLSERTIG